MNNYLLFVGLTYYPSGGAKDLHGSYKERGKAIDDGRAMVRDEGGGEDWWHVYAIDQGRIVAHGRKTYSRGGGDYTEKIEP